MAPHDTRNIFCNNNEESEVPVVFPHHLLMIAVADTANKVSTVKACVQDPMENSLAKTISENLSKSSECVNETQKETEDEQQDEIRLIIEMTCRVEVAEDNSETKLSLLLRLEDKMNRQLSCTVSENETGIDLATELVEYGLINELDLEKVANKIDKHLETS